MNVYEIYMRMVAAYLSDRLPGETVLKLIRGGATVENMKLAGVDFDATFGPDYFPATPKYSNIAVELVGADDTVPKVLTKVHTAMIVGGVPNREISKFTSDAMSGDFYHTIRVVSSWVTLK